LDRSLYKISKLLPRFTWKGLIYIKPYHLSLHEGRKWARASKTGKNAEKTVEKDK